MLKNQDIPWKRIAAEAVAIVGSILLAFAIDAWWDERLERVEEKELLDRLHSEFSTNVERMSGPQYGLARIEASEFIYELIEAAESNGQSTINVPNLILVRFAVTATYEADTPVFDGTVRSGRLEIIQARSVLEALARWERLLRDYSQLADRARRNFDSRQMPVLASKGDIGPILMFQDDGGIFTDDPDPTEYTRLQVDAELKTIIGEGYRNSRHAKRIFDNAQEAAELVLAEIEREEMNP